MNIRHINISLLLLLHVSLIKLSNSQVIHRDELNRFMGVVEIIYPQKPTLLPANTPYKPQLTLTSDQFIGYNTDANIDSLRKFNSRQHFGTYRFSQAVMLPDYSQEKFMLEIPEHNMLITSLHNYGWETSLNIIAFWAIHGKNLTLDWVNTEVFREGLGNIAISPEYIVLPDTSIVFVLHSGGGDAGFVYFTDCFLHLAQRKEVLQQLVAKCYGRDIDNEIQTKVDYSFISMTTNPIIRFVEQKYKWIFEDDRRQKIIDSVIVEQDTSRVEVLDLIKKHKKLSH